MRHVPDGDLVSLGTWPTPLEHAPRLSVALGLRPEDLWIKRDDLTSLGGGGNKVRKLQYLCTEALARSATTLVTTGAPQSNHARLTAAAGARLGLDVVLVLAGEPGAGSESAGNLVLNGLFGATIEWAGAGLDDVALAARAEEVAAGLEAKGEVVEVIPFGGSSVTGSRGYVDCGHEVSRQASGLAQVVVALGSGGTMAGLVRALGPNRVLGVHTGAIPDPRGQVTSLVDGLAGVGQPGHEGLAGLDPGRLRIRFDQVGAGYPELTDGARWALQTAARTEGLVLDPVYTGRALAGLRAAVADGTVVPGQRTVFLHSGGLPGLFGHAEAMTFASTDPAG
jgi:D-cysteine desulfhydrase